MVNNSATTHLKSKKTRTKPTRFILACLVAVAVGLLMVRSLHVPILQAQQHQSYHQALKSAASDIAHFIESRKAEVRLLADLPQLGTMNWQTIQPLLTTRLNAKHQDFEKFVLALPNGNFYSSVTGNPHQQGLVTQNDADPYSPKITLSERDYWRVVLHNNLEHQQITYVSNPMISYSSGVKQIMIASSIHHQGNVVGLLGGSISWDRITQLIDQISPEATIDASMENHKTRFMLVSKDGNYWYHWNPKKVIRKQTDQGAHDNPQGRPSALLFNILAEESEALKSLGRNMVAGKHGHTQLTLDGRAKEVFYMPIQNTNYSLAQVVDSGEYKTLTRQFNVYLLVALIASMMVYLFLVYLIPKEGGS